MIDSIGWWEDEDGFRTRVSCVDSGWIFRWARNGLGTELPILCRKVSGNWKLLPDCTGWDWEPEPEIQEIEFPAWIVDESLIYVIRDYDDIYLSSNLPIKDKLGFEFDRETTAKFNGDIIDLSWVPESPGDWTKAIWKRKVKESQSPSE